MVAPFGFSRKDAQRVAEATLGFENLPGFLTQEPRSGRNRGGWNVPEMLGKTDSSIADGSSGMVSIWAGDTEADTGEDRTCYNFSGSSIAADTPVFVVPANGRLYVSPIAGGGGIKGEIGVTQTTLSYRQSCIVDVYSGAGGSESDSGIDVTAWDWLLSDPATQPWALTEVPAGTNCVIMQTAESSIWYVIAVVCTDTTPPIGWSGNV